MNRAEREFRNKCDEKPILSDDAFIQRFYSHGVSHEVALRVRHILGEQLNLNKIEPSDRPCDILQDIDLSEIVQEVAENFGVSISHKELASLDGSVDSIVRLIDKKVTGREN